MLNLSNIFASAAVVTGTRSIILPGNTLELKIERRMDRKFLAKFNKSPNVSNVNRSLRARVFELLKPLCNCKEDVNGDDRSGPFYRRTLTNENIVNVGVAIR